MPYFKATSSNIPEDVYARLFVLIITRNHAQTSDAVNLAVFGTGGHGDHGCLPAAWPAMMRADSRTLKSERFQLLHLLSVWPVIYGTATDRIVLTAGCGVFERSRFMVTTYGGYMRGQLCNKVAKQRYRKSIIVH